MSVVVLLAGGVVTLTVLSFSNHAIRGSAKVGQMATKQAGATPQSIGGTQGGATAQYNREVARQNALKAKVAIKSGGSFLPTPSHGSTPISLPNFDNLGVVKKTTPQPVVSNTKGGQPVPTNMKSPPPSSSVAVLTNRRSPTGKFMDTVMSQWMRAQAPQVHVWGASAAPGGRGGSTGTIVAGTAAVAAVPAKPIVASPLRVGHIYYAVNLLAANSDQPGTPVLAEVVSGPMTGARFIGGFKIEDNRLLLEFSEVVFHKKVWKTTSFGVDPSTAQPSLASRVNYHYFSRWGGLVAASFLEGFGRAVQQRGSTMTQFAGGNGISTVYSTPKLNTKAESEIALGKVGQKVGEQLDKGFNRPPTVYLRKGVALGLLVLKK